MYVLKRSLVYSLLYKLNDDDEHRMIRMIIAALWNRASHYIFALWFLSSFFFLVFFPRLISAVADWTSTILLHMAWP